MGFAAPFIRAATVVYPPHFVLVFRLWRSLLLSTAVR